MFRVILTFALLASAITTNKLLLNPLPPILFVGIRMLIAGIILLALNWFQGKKIHWPVIKQDLPILLLITLCTTYIPAICKSIALKYMTSSKAAFFGSLDPFITALYSYFIFKEKLTIYNCLGIAIAIIGSTILITGDAQLTDATILVSTFSTPQIAAFLAIAIGRYGWILIQMLLKKNHYTPIQINGITMLGSGVISLVTSLMFEQYSQIYIDNYSYFILLMLYTILIGNVFSLTLYASLLKTYSATFLSLAGFLVPFFVYVYGLIFLGEPISMHFLIALGLTFIGLLIFSIKRPASC